MNVILFSNDCPKCKILKKKLDEAKVDYEICSDMDEIIGRGYQSMPMFEVGEDEMNFTQAIAWVRKYAEVNNNGH